MSETKSCPKCGGAIAAGGAGGLCPKCLLMGAEADAEMTAATMGGGGGSAWVPPTVEELAGAIPGCEVEGLIGRGGMGAVYRAKQGELDRVVAVKVLPKELGDEGGFAERFRREAQVMAKLDHRNIVRVFDFGQAASGHFYFVMEYVDGMDLQRMIRSGEVGEKEALSIVGQVCDALEYAHDAGFVHRDIKPANLMLTKDGTVKVGDFGIARVLGDTPEGGAMLTAAGQGLGTAVYAAPEQLSGGGAIDHRADIYSLGVVLYEMLTGEVPRGSFDLPSERVKVDVRLDEVVVRAMKSSPDRRYQAIGDVKTDVETIAGGAVPPQAPAEATGVAAGGHGKGSRRGMWGCVIVGCIIGGLLLVLAVPVILWVSYRSVSEEEHTERAQAVATEQMAEIQIIEAGQHSEIEGIEASATLETLGTIHSALGFARQVEENPGDSVRLVETSCDFVQQALEEDGRNPDVLAVAAEVYRTLGLDELEREMAKRFMEAATRDHPRWKEIEEVLRRFEEIYGPEVESLGVEPESDDR